MCLTINLKDEVGQSLYFNNCSRLDCQKPKKDQGYIAGFCVIIRVMDDLLLDLDTKFSAAMVSLSLSVTSAARWLKVPTDSRLLPQCHRQG